MIHLRSIPSFIARFAIWNFKLAFLGLRAVAFCAPIVYWFMNPFQLQSASMVDQLAMQIMVNSLWICVAPVFLFLPEIKRCVDSEKASNQAMLNLGITCSIDYSDSHDPYVDRHAIEREEHLERFGFHYPSHPDYHLLQNA